MNQVARPGSKQHTVPQGCGFPFRQAQEFKGDL